MMTAMEYQARMAIGASKVLAHWLGTTRPDKLNWRPAVDETSNTRSAMEMVHECVYANLRTAAAFRGEEPKRYEKSELPFNGDVEEAKRQLLESAEMLAAAILDADESILTKRFTFPFGEVSGAFILTTTLGNMQYHGGQICFIQRLYGDTEFSFPEEMMR